MPKSRATEMPQRQLPRGQLNNLRTSSSDSDPLHHRLRSERSPKLSEGRSPRGAQSDPVNQKKLGTRIADLESQLGQAQTELKSLKNQLSSAESAKKAAQEQLDKKSKKNQKILPEPVYAQEKHSSKELKEIENETDVFEVPVEKVTVEQSKSEMDLPDEPKPHSVVMEPENLPLDDTLVKNDEIKSLMGKLDEKEKELESFRQENESLKSQLTEKSIKISSAESEIEELTLKMKKVDHDLDESKNSVIQVNEKLSATEKAKEELENEMKMLRVQTEQWRKAADAAASVLAGGADMNGRRISERCGSMDKHYGSGFEHVGAHGGYVGSPGLGDDSDDVFGSGKRKGSGMKMFGDLWKKKGQK